MMLQALPVRRTEPQTKDEGWRPLIALRRASAPAGARPTTPPPRHVITATHTPHPRRSMPSQRSQRRRAARTAAATHRLFRFRAFFNLWRPHAAPDSRRTLPRGVIPRPGAHLWYMAPCVARGAPRRLAAPRTAQQSASLPSQPAAAAPSARRGWRSHCATRAHCPGPVRMRAKGRARGARRALYLRRRRARRRRAARRPQRGPSAGSRARAPPAPRRLRRHRTPPRRPSRARPGHRRTQRQRATSELVNISLIVRAPS